MHGENSTHQSFWSKKKHQHFCSSTCCYILLSDPNFGNKTTKHMKTSQKCKGTIEDPPEDSSLTWLQKHSYSIKWTQEGKPQKKEHSLFTRCWEDNWIKTSRYSTNSFTAWQFIHLLLFCTYKLTPPTVEETHDVVLTTLNKTKEHPFNNWSVWPTCWMTNENVPSHVLNH